MSEWIPIEDAAINDAKRYEVTSRSGKVLVVEGHCVARSNVLAIREYNPEPYVPPKPKRRVVIDKTGRFMREVLPGDPDPDRVIETIEMMRKYEGYAAGDLNKWADRLEGKNE